MDKDFIIVLEIENFQVSFWISRDSAPARTIIGVMTVLTETHLMTGTNRRLPPVAYVKAVDVYLGFCYLLVVLALMEYAAVAYSKVGGKSVKYRWRTRRLRCSLK